MTKITFKGSLIDIDGNILVNYKVLLFYLDSNPLKPDRELGKTSTDSEGEFKFSYPSNPNDVLFDNKSAKIKAEIRFLDEKIYETTFTVNFKDEIIDFGIIEVKGPNRGTKGRVLDENLKPLSGLVVEAWGAGNIESTIKDSRTMKLADKISPVSLNNDSELGKSQTDKNGFYEIFYPPSQYNNILNEKPDITVVVKDLLGVTELFKTEKYSAVTETIKKIEDITIPREWAEGWFVTLGGSEKSRFSSDNHLEILIDNQIELERIVQSINHAKSFVYLSQFELDSDFVAIFKSSKDEKLEPHEVLVDVLKTASERGVDVKIILNENLIVPDSYQEIEDYFQSSGVEVRQFKSHGLYVMHAKTLVVDGDEAFIIGSPFVPDYWDTPYHLINDPRRIPLETRPVHDVSVKLKGKSVSYVEEFFIEMWNYISKEEYQGKGKLNPLSKPPASGKSQIQIARSITPETLSKKGELGIYEAYRKAIAKAKDYIYLENQFFTNKCIIKTLKNAMNNNPDLQVIVVMNENPDNPGYKNWQNQCLEKLGIQSVEDVLEHPQIGLFTLWSAESSERQFRIQPIYVHSKVALVDDRWATVGTANLDGSSLTYVNELDGFFDTSFYRNMEINAIIPDMDKKSGEVKNLRQALWSEHLGIGEDMIKKEDKGWLGLWQKRAAENINSISKNKSHLKAQILPYSFEDTSKSQLKDMGLDVNKWDVLE
jgi:phosphatidylserine/phosphatidylglycerophosphate/cardiolipin synthase-like enzyme